MPAYDDDDVAAGVTMGDIWADLDEQAQDYDALAALYEDSFPP